MVISNIKGRAVFDSNGYPAFECEIILENGLVSRAIAPRGATTGIYEQKVTEDAAAGSSLKSIEPALKIINSLVKPSLVGLDITKQHEIDEVINGLNINIIGGNVAVATSIAVAKNAAKLLEVPVYKYLSDAFQTSIAIPTPIFNLIDGADSKQRSIFGIEFLVIPDRELSVSSTFEIIVNLKTSLKTLLKNKDISIGESAQGAFALNLSFCEDGLNLIKTISEIGHQSSSFSVGLDMAASDYFDNDFYRFSLNSDCKVNISPDELMTTYLRWVDKFNLVYLEDPFSEVDEKSWQNLYNLIPPKFMLVGDDLFATSSKRITEGVNAKWANSIVIKPNQIGTITETIRSIQLAKLCNMCTIVSQRSGENDDAFITHLAVACGVDYLKAGGLSRMDRIIKFNELLRISESLIF